jgi:serine/threonine protein kinase
MIGHCKKQTINGFEFIILTELMKCDLEDLIRNEPNLTNLQRVAISTGIARGMKRIHDTGFIHRDIKPANCIDNSEQCA